MDSRGKNKGSQQTLLIQAIALVVLCILAIGQASQATPRDMEGDSDYWKMQDLYYLEAFKGWSQKALKVYYFQRAGKNREVYRESKKFRNSPEYKARNEEFYPMMDAVIAFPSRKPGGIQTLGELLQVTKDFKAPRLNGRGYNAYQVLLARSGCADPNNLVRAAVIWSKSQEQNVNLNLASTIQNVDGYIRSLNQTLSYTQAHNAANVDQIAWLENAISMCEGFKQIVSNQPEQALDVLTKEIQTKAERQDNDKKERSLILKEQIPAELLKKWAELLLIIDRSCAMQKNPDCYRENLGERMYFGRD